MNLKDESGDFKWRIAGPPGKLRKVKERDLEKWKETQQQRKAKQANKPNLMTRKKASQVHQNVEEGLPSEGE